VIAYDVRGAGASSRPRDDRAYDLTVLADDMTAVIDAVSPGRPVHVVGHDWGAGGAVLVHRRAGGARRRPAGVAPAGAAVPGDPGPRRGGAAPRRRGHPRARRRGRRGARWVAAHAAAVGAPPPP